MKSKTDTIYFDLSKAFDYVPHDLLLHKLTQFGNNGRLLNWLINSLSNRYQREHVMEAPQTGCP